MPKLRDFIDWKTYLSRELSSHITRGKIRERFAHIFILFGDDDLIKLHIEQLSDSTINVTINWGCIGQTDVITAARFVESMVDACEAANFVHEALYKWEEEYDENVFGENMS